MHGRALMDTVEDWARAQKSRFLTLNVFAANQRALAFYERSAFRADYVRFMKPLTDGEMQDRADITARRPALPREHGSAHRPRRFEIHLRAEILDATQRPPLRGLFYLRGQFAPRHLGRCADRYNCGPCADAEPLHVEPRSRFRKRPEPHFIIRGSEFLADADGAGRARRDLGRLVSVHARLREGLRIVRAR
jgi:hypothetical protein